MKKIAACLIALIPFALLAAERTDSARREPHVLRPVEVLGVKQMPGGANSAEAITRISGAQARVLGVEAVKGISAIAPNFFMPDYGSRMTSAIYVRGLGARMDQPVVGLSIDNVPVLNKDNYDLDIADIESIEVLRGPQTVLNGRNTMGGQINIRTLSPLTAKGWRFCAGYGNGNTSNASASYYGRIAPSAGMSLTAQFRHTDGFFRNAFNGKRLDTENSGTLRWKTAWRPSPRLSLANTASAAIVKQGGYPYAKAETGTIAFNDSCAYRRTNFADGLTVVWAGERVVVSSLTSVQYSHDSMTLDQDFTSEPYFTLTQARKECTMSQDLFTRGSRGAYSWLGGVFAFYRTTAMDAPVTFKHTGIERLIEAHRNQINPTYPIEWASRQFTLGSDFKPRSASGALYHESVWRTGRWRFEAGLRLDVEKTSLSYRSHCNTGYNTWHILPDGSRQLFSTTPVVVDDADRISRTYIEFIPKFTAAYETQRATAYFNFAKGYKAGGYNTQMFSDVLQQRIMSIMGMSQLYSLDQVVAYEPERSLNYELGLKIAPANNLSAEAVLFFIDCRNQQLTVFPPGTTTGRIMTNAGRTRSFGAEITANWAPTSDINARLSYGYTNATFRNYNDGRADYRGRHVPYAPENTLFAQIGWTATPLSFCGITPSINADANCAGRIWWNEANALSQPFYCLTGASAALNAPKWSVRLWVKNLTGTRYNSFYFLSMGNAFVQRGLPRRFGITLRLNLQ